MGEKAERKNMGMWSWCIYCAESPAFHQRGENKDAYDLYFFLNHAPSDLPVCLGPSEASAPRLQMCVA